MEDQKLVSVIIPSYNRAKFVTDAIDSVLAQTKGKVEVIVVDDGSTDNTAEAVARYGDKVRYLYQENQGAATARNLGLSVATGDFIGFLDSDDMWMPDKLAIELPFFEQDPQLEAIISDSETWSKGELVVGSWFYENTYIVPIPHGPTLFSFDCEGWAKGGLVATCCILLRRSGLEKIGPPFFNTSLGYFEDWEFELRMYYHCKVLIHPTVVAKVRRFDDGTRKNRPFPGEPFSPEQEAYRCKYQIEAMQQLLQLEGLSDRTRELGMQKIRKVRERQSELLAEIK